MQLSRASVGAVVLLAAVLTGCIATRDYEGPTSAEIAYVDVMSVKGGDLGPIIFDKAGDCS